MVFLLWLFTVAHGASFTQLSTQYHGILNGRDPTTLEHSDMIKISIVARQLVAMEAEQYAPLRRRLIRCVTTLQNSVRVMKIFPESLYNVCRLSLPAAVSNHNQRFSEFPGLILPVRPTRLHLFGETVDLVDKFIDDHWDQDKNAGILEEEEEEEEKFVLTEALIDEPLEEILGANILEDPQGQQESDAIVKDQDMDALAKDQAGEEEDDEQDASADGETTWEEDAARMIRVLQADSSVEVQMIVDALLEMQRIGAFWLATDPDSLMNKLELLLNRWSVHDLDEDGEEEDGHGLMEMLQIYRQIPNSTRKSILGDRLEARLQQDTNILYHDAWEGLCYAVKNNYPPCSSVIETYEEHGIRWHGHGFTKMEAQFAQRMAELKAGDRPAWYPCYAVLQEDLNTLKYSWRPTTSSLHLHSATIKLSAWLFSQSANVSYPFAPLQLALAEVNDLIEQTKKDRVKLKEAKKKEENDEPIDSPPTPDSPTNQLS